MKFFFAPADARALGLFRIALGLVMMVEAAMVLPSLNELYGAHGFLDAGLMRAVSGRSLPLYYQLVEGAGLPYGSFLLTLYWLRWAGLLAFTAGLYTLPATFVVWLTQSLFMASGSLSSYGLNRYFHVFIFLLLFMPAGRALSLDARRRSAPAAPSWEARFSLRTLQLTLLFTYLNSGTAKAFGADWWNGNAIWRVLNLPEFNRFPFLWLSGYPWIPKGLGLGTLFLETLYPLGVWIPGLGLLWTLAIIGMHLGIAALMGLVNFGLGMALFNAVLFIYPKAQESWRDPAARRRAVGRIGRLAPGLTAGLAAYHFRTTERFSRPAWEAELAKSAERLALPNSLYALRWRGTGPTVLLVHGWSGRGTQLGAFIPPLLRAGFTVVALDAAGHGGSPGRATDLGEFSRSVLAAGKAAGPFRGVIAHSFGGVASAAAAAQGLGVARMVLIGVPCTIGEIFANYGEAVGLPPKAYSQFLARGEAKAGWRVAEIDVGRMLEALNIPALVVHDGQDPVVPLAQAKKIAAERTGIRLFETNGLGHRKILKDEAVIAETVKFLQQ